MRIILIGVMLLIACNPEKLKYRRFSPNILYHIYGGGEEGAGSSHRIGEASAIILKVRCCGDTTIMDTAGVVLFMTSRMPSDFKDFLLNLYEGDSVRVMGRLEYFKETNLPVPDIHGKASEVALDIKIQRVIDEKDLIARTQLEKGSYKEDEIIKYVLAKVGKRPEECYQDGIYVLEFKQGRGALPQKGYTVIMHYRGYLPDGFVFDDSWDRNAPFYWTVGTPDQIIPGLEKIVMKMRNGSYARVLIPSRMAFGEHGSLSGLVPPYTPVIYEVWVLYVVP